MGGGVAGFGVVKLVGGQVGEIGGCAKMVAVIGG